MSGKQSIWNKIYPAKRDHLATNSRDRNALELPQRGAFDPAVEKLLNPASADLVSSEDARSIVDLPENRILQYGVFDSMAKDPTIDTGLRLHVAQALSAKEGSGEILSIESTTDKDDPITKDLRDTFKATLNANMLGWAYNAAKYGVWFLRPYGTEGKGISYIRSDYYCHPKFINMYERAGQLVGYTSAYQNISAAPNGMELIDPWKFIPIKMPIWEVRSDKEPVRFDDDTFDISSDDIENESIVESTNYGRSLIQTTYGPWLDLQNAILSLNMSRKNAARLERLIGVNTGMLSPERAAAYLSEIANQLMKSSKDHARASLSKGFVQTVENRIIPIWGDSKGRLDINTVEGTPNIDGLADLDFHVKRLGSALGIDPSLLGFGEMLSGGLGEGGFFRVSTIASSISNAIKSAVIAAVEQLFITHIALKHGKYYPPGQRPWRVVLHSTATALDREQTENFETRINTATMIATLVQTMDPQASGYDTNVLSNFLFTDVMKVDEEKFKGIFSKKITNKKEVPNRETDQITESAGVSEYIEKLMQQHPTEE